MRAVPLLLLFAFAFTGCDALFGAKDDATTDEIFDEGAVDPTQLSAVGYVPLNPFFETGAMGAFDAPTDVYVGYDEFVYVTDAAGLHVLDLAGRPQRFVDEVGGQRLRDAVAVMQDRRLDLYVAARRDTLLVDTTVVMGDTTITSEEWDLPVVYHFSDVTTGGADLVDIIWHPFDDASRSGGNFRNPSEEFMDEEAAFTGIAVLGDNRVYISRRGPFNPLGISTVGPHNAILLFSPDGENLRDIDALDPTTASLRSAVYPSDVATYFGPPQQFGDEDNESFLVAQAPPDGAPRYAVLSIVVEETINGTEYRVDTQKLSAASDTSNGDGFLYEGFKFDAPSALAYAADGTGYIFVTDTGTDSLYVFNPNGVEGVAPPPGAGTIRPVDVSFGGTGSGPLSFRDPEGVAYFERTVYVADTGNNRIARYRLNTDFE